MIKPKQIDIKTIQKAIDDEPELPGEMPTELWIQLQNNKDFLTEAFRATVRATKKGIKKRLSI